MQNGCSCGDGPDDGLYPPKVPVGKIESWIDLLSLQPRSPLELVAYTKLGSTAGTYKNSANFKVQDSDVWVACPVTLASAPECKANGTDSGQCTANALQWNAHHVTSALGYYAAPPTQKMITLRAGTEWYMEFTIDFGEANFGELQLSYRNNAATRGDMAGTTPVI